MTLRSVGQFLALSFICLAIHQLGHHIVARVACGGWGDWGTLGFGGFERSVACAGSGVSFWAVLAGPLLTWLLIWGGRAMVRHGEVRAGVMLILANLPLARVLAALTGRGDEMAIAEALVPGKLLWLPVIGLTLLLFWSPIETVYRALSHRHRWGWLTLALVAPLAWSALLTQVLLGALVSRYPVVSHGMPLIVMLVLALAFVALVALRRPRNAAFAMVSGQVFAVSGSWRAARSERTPW